MRYMLSVVGLTVVLSTPAASQVLSWEGIGPVRLGMTVKEATRRLGAPFQPRDKLTFTSDMCWVTGRADGKDQTIQYVIVDGKISVINVFPSNGQTPRAVDTHGIGVGSTEADIRQAYGQVNRRLAPYFSEEDEIKAAAKAPTGPDGEPPRPPEYWVQVESSDRKRVMIFNTFEGRVTWMRSGLKPRVADIEDCI